MKASSLVERIEGVDLSSATASEVANVIADLARLDGWSASIAAQAARRAHQLEESGGGAPAADVIARNTHTSRRNAERVAARSETLGHTPTVERQLAKGRISTEHADALTNAAKRLADDDERAALFAMDTELAAHAASDTPNQFARRLTRVSEQIAADDGLDRSEHQRRSATLSHGLDAETGMAWIRAELHPDDYQRVKGRLEAAVTAAKKGGDDRRYDQIAASALVDLVTGARSTSTPPPEVTVLVDLDTITNGLHAHSVLEYGDGSPLPVETARRHACDAKIIPAVLDSEGMPLDVGRARRHATPAQRHALRAMYRTCAVGGCETGFDRCDIHHLREWEKHRGPTDFDNLLPLCSHHHHRAHEGRWRLQLDRSTRQLTVTLPDGSHHSTCLPDIIDERRRNRAA